MLKKTFFISLIIFLASFIYYLRPIINNKPYFMTDEMYWISTAKTVHMLWHKDTTNPLWREHYGFANLNGAKIIYGIGLALFGHFDVGIVGIAPDTYYRWVSFDGGSFPDEHRAYPLLRDARIISAIFTAGVIPLIFILAHTVSLSIPLSILAAIIMTMHPISYLVATHVFSDGIFLFFEVLLLLLLLLRNYKNRDIYIGITFALLVSTKLNGLLFAPVILLIYVLKQNIRHVSNVALGTIVTMLILHPNFIFYHGYSPLQLLKDRVQITNDHIAYFSNINPSHVVLELPQRLASLTKQTFPSWLLRVLTAISFFLFVNDSIKRRVPHDLKLFFSIGIYVTLFVLSYTVFDESRYYFPILPFIAIIASYITPKRHMI